MQPIQLTTRHYATRLPTDVGGQWLEAPPLKPGFLAPALALLLLGCADPGQQVGPSAPPSARHSQATGRINEAESTFGSQKSP